MERVNERLTKMSKKPELLFFDSNVYINLLRFPEYESRTESVSSGGSVRNKQNCFNGTMGWCSNKS